MPYVDVTKQSGLGQWTMMKRLTTSLRSVVPKLTTITAPAIMPARPALFTGVTTAIKPAVVAAVVKEAEAVAIARRVAAERLAAQVEADRKAEAVAAAIAAKKISAAVIMPFRPPVVGRPYLPTTIRVKGLRIRRPIPLTYAHRPPVGGRVPPDYKTESGSTYKTTQVEVVPGPDIHAPTTGQSISLKETDSIIPLSATREGIQITDETEPTVPTFVEAAAVAPAPWMKYGLLAIGGYILYDTFVKSKPKQRRRRR